MTTTPDITSSTLHGDRSITTRYTLDDTEQQDRHGDQVRLALELTTHHDRERKRYVSRASRIQISTHMIRQVFDFREPQPPLGTVTVATPRYNSKALSEAHAAFETAAAEADTLAALLAWAADQHTDA